MMNNINYLKERKIIMIYKWKGSIEKGENYRPIGLSNIFNKLINKISINELNKYWKYIDYRQVGFRKNNHKCQK